MLEKMRNEFELEREGYAVTERDLRARITSEAERNQALSAKHVSLQQQLEALEEQVESLRIQNASLVDAYVTAKRLTAELVRGASDLALTFTDDPAMPEAKAAAPEHVGETAASDDEEDAEQVEAEEQAPATAP